MKIDVPSQRAIEGKADQATSEEIIYWMALAEAKMKVVNWRETLMRVRMKRGMTLASMVVIIGILLSACGPVNGSGTVTSGGTERPTISAPGPSLTDEWTATPKPTETLVWTATPVPTETMALPTLTPTETATIAPPNLPDEFFSAVPAGEYEVRNDGVYALDADGEMRMWYEEQADGSFIEVYFRYGEPLTEQKIAELASRLVCEQAETCISEGPYGSQNPVMYFEFISTGVAEKQAIYDTGTGEIKGYLWDMVVVSRDINQNPITVREVMQVEHLDRPGVNQYPEAAGYYFPEVGLSSELAYSIQEVGLYQEYLPEGRMRTYLSLPAILWQVPNYAAILEELLGNFGSFEQQESAFRFIASGGVDNEEGVVIWMFNEIEREIK